MKVKNIFTQGIISDIDNSIKKPDQWDFPTLNARVVNRKGQGFIITNFPGNKEEFALKTGYAVHGACEHNGILYIQSIEGNGPRGEIGCFPSPTRWALDNTTFVREYKAFYNYAAAGVGTLAGEFNTEAFNLNPEFTADIFAPRE